MTSFALAGLPFGGLRGWARERIGANVNPLLALEAMALQLRLPR